MFVPFSLRAIKAYSRKNAFEILEFSRRFKREREREIWRGKEKKADREREGKNVITSNCYKTKM